MTIKKIIALILALTVLFCTSCTLVPGDKNDTPAEESEDSNCNVTFESENDSLIDTDKITISGKTVTYCDEFITFSWESDGWYYEMKDGAFTLSKHIDGVTYAFAVFKAEKGMAADLSEYTGNAIVDYFENEVSLSEIMAVSTSSAFADENAITLSTGAAHIESEMPSRDKGFVQSSISSVYGITNGCCTVVIGSMVYDEGSAIKKLYETITDEGNFSAIELQTSEILDSFHFVDASKEEAQE